MFGFLSKKSVLLGHVPSLFVMRVAWIMVSNVTVSSMLRQRSPSVDLPGWGWQVHSPLVKIHLTVEISSTYILSPRAQFLMFSVFFFFQKNRGIIIFMNLLFKKVNFRSGIFLNKLPKCPLTKNTREKSLLHIVEDLMLHKFLNNVCFFILS